MRHSHFFLIFLILFSSCSREIADYDFGKFEYDDPFYGISEEYRPEFLKKTLEYPPFSWFTDDSTYQSAYLFHVEFNEECVRDKEPVEFCITDPAGNVINYLSIECEGKVTHNGFSTFTLILYKKTFIFLLMLRLRLGIVLLQEISSSIGKL